MRSTKQRDTAAELALRRCLHAKGLRYRVNRGVLPGMTRKADLLFAAARVVVFVDGCFWHCCPVHGTWPKANSAWWAAKLRGNEQRDRDTDRRLREAGWRVERVWEHEVPAKAAARISSVVRVRLRRI